MSGSAKVLKFPGTGSSAEHTPDFRALVEEAKLDELPSIVGRFAEGQALALLRLRMAGPQNDMGGTGQPDGSLNAEEAGRRLGMSASWLYKNHRRLPFAAKQGRRVVFSARGLERWQAARMRA